MKNHSFESEFSPEDLPSVSGEPLSNAKLDAHVDDADKWIRIERAQQIAVLEAVRGFYLAKYLPKEMHNFDRWSNKVAPRAVDVVAERLLRLAVIDIAKVNDSSQIGRAASLPGVLTAMRKVLSESAESTAPETSERVKELQRSIDANVHLPLKYVRHLRNKWAGHPSMDRDFDHWADANETLHMPLLEEALAMLVRTHQLTADLMEQCPVLQTNFSTPPPLEDEEGWRPAVVNWSAVTILASLAKENGIKSASAIRDQLVSPPSYGSAADTDWSQESEHHLLRDLQDEQLKVAQIHEIKGERITTPETIHRLRRRLELDLGEPGGWSVPLEFLDSLALCALNSTYSHRSPAKAVLRILARYGHLRQSGDKDSGPDLIRAMDNVGGPEAFAYDVLQNKNKLPGTSRLWASGVYDALSRLAALDDPVTTTDHLRARADDPAVKSAWLSVTGLGPRSWSYLLMNAGVDTKTKSDEMLQRYLSRAMGHDEPFPVAVLRWLLKTAAREFHVTPRTLERAIWHHEWRFQKSSANSCERFWSSAVGF